MGAAPAAEGANILSGTLEGGIKARETNKKQYGKDYYSRIGQIGGSKKVKKGFAMNRELARTSGAKGGAISRRRPSTP